jgi:hypothetical protein
MSAIDLDPVLVIGGSGVVGRRAVAALRHLQPELRIAVGGRDLGRAEAVAAEVGRASATAVDLDRADLGLARARFSAVVVLLKDDTLRTLRYAQRARIPYVSFSDFAFDIGPEVALFARDPASAPILLLGHYLGGMVTMVTLWLARELRRVHSIAIGGVFDEDDVGGPANASDMERLVTGVPLPLLREDGRFFWPAGAAATRVFRGSGGTEWHGRAYPMLDVVSLAAATGARAVRVDAAVRPRTSRPPGVAPWHEVVIEIAGERPDGSTARSRHVLIDRDVHSGLSGRGAALAVERLLGLAGGPPAAPGLHHPERLLDPDYVVRRLADFGARIEQA